MSQVIITYRQCKAARDLLDWKQDDLSKKSKVTKSTIGDFERGVREIRISTLEKIINTFQKAGIRFENDDEKYGVELLKEFEEK